MRTYLLILTTLLSIICFSQADNKYARIINKINNNITELQAGKIKEHISSRSIFRIENTNSISFDKNLQLTTRIEIPVGDDPFYTNLEVGEAKDYSILSGTMDTPYSILVDVLNNKDEIFAGVDVNIDDICFIGNYGGSLLYDIYFDLTAIKGFPAGTYEVKIVTLFLNESSDLTGGYERENVFLTINGENIITSDVVINRFSNPPVIDGVIDKVWSNVEPVAIENESVDNSLPSSINYAFWKMAYSDDAFFILIEVEDNEFCDQWCTGFADWQSDRAEIFFDVYTENLRDGRGANNSGNNGPWYGHYQFTTPWKEGLESYANSGALQWPKDVPFDYGYERNAGSWFYEMIVPFSSLTIDSIEDVKGPFMASDSLKIGFCANILDVDISDGLDNGQPYRKIIAWKDSDCWISMDNAGIVQLGNEIIDNEIEDPASITSIIESNNIFIYPNPATNFITLNIQNKITDIKIYDMLGNIVLVKNHIDLEEKIDISSLSSGLYFLKTDELVVVFAKHK